MKLCVCERIRPLCFVGGNDTMPWNIISQPSSSAWWLREAPLKVNTASVFVRNNLSLTHTHVRCRLRRWQTHRAHTQTHSRRVRSELAAYYFSVLGKGKCTGAPWLSRANVHFGINICAAGRRRVIQFSGIKGARPCENSLSCERLCAFSFDIYLWASSPRLNTNSFAAVRLLLR